MATTTTTQSRSLLVEPDENHDGGTLLHSRVSALRILLGDHSASRYFEFTGIADSTTVEAAHNMGANLSNFRVIIYTGSGTTKVLVNDSVDLGYAIAEKAGFEKTILEITTPGSGGPHSFVVVMVDANQAPHAIFQKLVANLGSAPAETVKTWWDDDGRGLVINQTGQIYPTQGLKQVNVSSNFNALPGNHYQVDTSGGPVTATQPATVNLFDKMRFSDANKSFGTNNLTIGRNGNNIDSLAADLVLATDGDWAELSGDTVPATDNWVKDGAGAISEATSSVLGSVKKNQWREKELSADVTLNSANPTNLDNLAFSGLTVGLHYRYTLTLLLDDVQEDTSRIQIRDDSGGTPVVVRTLILQRVGVASATTHFTQEFSVLWKATGTAMDLRSDNNSGELIKALDSGANQATFAVLEELNNYEDESGSL